MAISTGSCTAWWKYTPTFTPGHSKDKSYISSWKGTVPNNPHFHFSCSTSTSTQIFFNPRVVKNVWDSTEIIIYNWIKKENEWTSALQGILPSTAAIQTWILSHLCDLATLEPVRKLVWGLCLVCPFSAAGNAQTLDGTFMFLLLI